MPQLSKLLQSREDWRSKAIHRATENRENRKQTAFHRQQISELKAQVKELERAIGDKKTESLSELTQPPSV